MMVWKLKYYIQRGQPSLSEDGGGGLKSKGSPCLAQVGVDRIPI